MISLDTNILVRFITRDNETQLHDVLKLFHSLEKDNKQAFIPLMVVLEVNWVLSQFYKMSRIEIIEYLLPLFDSSILVIENASELRKILIDAKDNTFDLSDLLIGCGCAVANNLPIVTFDKKASKIDNFIAMKDII